MKPPRLYWTWILIILRVYRHKAKTLSQNINLSKLTTWADQWSKKQCAQNGSRQGKCGFRGINFIIKDLPSGEYLGRSGQLR